MYILVKNGSIVSDSYSLNKLRQDNPDVSFPVVITSEILQEFGVFYLEDNPPTNVDPYRSVRKTDITFTSTGNGFKIMKLFLLRNRKLKHVQCLNQKLFALIVISC